MWTQGDSAFRQAITAATNQIDFALQRNAGEMGESRDGGQRIWFVFPLALRFEVEHEQRLVRVLHVWSYRRRSE